jgi:hypothetical protein
MGLSRDELFDVLRGATLELARVAGVVPDPQAYPALARLAAFDREVEEGRRYEMEKGQKEWELEQEQYRRIREAGAARQQRDLEGIVATGGREGAWAAEQLARLRGEPEPQPGHSRVIVPR